MLQRLGIGAKCSLVKTNREMGFGASVPLRWSVVLLLAVTSTGCLGSLGVKEKHAAVHKCSSGDVTLKELENDGHAKYQSTGCGHEEIYYCILAKCRSPRVLSVRHHAAKHNCKMEEITTEEPSPNEFVTTGCGKTDRYRCKEVPDDVVACDRVK